MTTKSESIRTGIVTASGRTIYPTGIEWLLAFAIKGCQWAIDELPLAIERQQLRECETYFGGCI